MLYNSAMKICMQPQVYQKAIASQSYSFKGQRFSSLNEGSVIKAVNESTARSEKQLDLRANYCKARRYKL